MKIDFLNLLIKCPLIDSVTSVGKRMSGVMGESWSRCRKENDFDNLGSFFPQAFYDLFAARQIEHQNTTLKYLSSVGILKKFLLMMFFPKGSGINSCLVVACLITQNLLHRGTPSSEKFLCLRRLVSCLCGYPGTGWIQSVWY